jgi:hypothetical protein
MTDKGTVERIRRLQGAVTGLVEIDGGERALFSQKESRLKKEALSEPQDQLENGKDKIKIPLLLILLLILAWLFFVIVFPHNHSHELLLRYIFIFNNWSFAILVLGIFLLSRLGPTIIELIRSGVHVKKGDLEVQFLGPREARPELPEKVVGVPQDESNARKLENCLRNAYFERLIRYLFRSQYNLLLFLKRAGPWPMPHCYEAFYKQQYIQKFGGNRDYGPDKYFDFLTDQIQFIKIVSKDNINNYALTPMGEIFIDYCRDMLYQDTEFKAL